MPSRRPHLALATLVLACAAAALSANFAPATNRATSLEYEVKAAFLFNFTKFVQWPAEQFQTADAPFTICIIGDDPFGQTLDELVQGEAVNGHKISVVRTESEQKVCQVEYFGRNSPSPAPAPSAGVLTVGEGRPFLKNGGVIAFILDEGRVRFDINMKAGASAGLKMSSKLLAVARSVER